MNRFLTLFTIIAVFALTLIAQPTISSINPTSGTVGSSLAINGTNFNATAASNIVTVGGARAIVTAASASSLTVTVPAGGAYGPVRVTVEGLMAESMQRFITKFTGDGVITPASLGTQVTLTKGSVYATSEIAAADMDGDGKTDLLVPTGSSLILYRNLASAESSLSASSFDNGADVPIVAGAGVVVGDLDGDGRPEVVATTAGQSTVHIFPNTSVSGTISLGTRIDLTPGLSNGTPGFADLDLDGKPDLVFGVSGSLSGANSLVVLRNTSAIGSITFAEPLSFGASGTGFSPVGDLVTGDFDSDGRIDAAIIQQNYLHTYRNTTTTPGSINFAAYQTVVVYGTSMSLAAGDLNYDGKIDLVIPNKDTSPVGVELLRNTGSPGTISFAQDANYILPSKTLPARAEVGDLDGDGKLDIAVVYNTATNDSLSVYRNIAATTGGNLAIAAFTPMINRPVELNSRSITLADLSGDGRSDLVVGSSSSSLKKISLYQNFNGLVHIAAVSADEIVGGINLTLSGSGFSATAANNTVTVGGAPATVTTASATSLTLTVPNGLPLGPATISVTVASVSATYRVTVVPMPPRIASLSVSTGPVGTPVMVTGTGFDADPAKNIVRFAGVKASVSEATTTSLAVTVPAGAVYGPVTVYSSGLIARSTSPFGVTFAGDGLLTPSTLSDSVVLSTGQLNYSYGLNFGDLTGDDKPEVLLNRYGVHVFKNNITGPSFSSASFSPQYPYAPGITYPLHGSTTADMNNDGKPDFVTAAYQNNKVVVLGNEYVSGEFDYLSLQNRFERSVAGGPYYIAVADLDGDGKLDMVTGANSGKQVAFMRNLSSNGSYDFAPTQTMASIGELFGLVLDDFDGDGKPDLAAVSYNNSYGVTVWKNTSEFGAISFGAPLQLTATTNPQLIASGDLNNDGKPEIIVGNSSDATGALSFFTNTSSGAAITFAGRIDFKVGLNSNILGLAVSDLDGDGKPDIVGADYGNNRIVTYRNQFTSGTLATTHFARLDFALAAKPYGLTVGDLNGDSKPEVGVTFRDSGRACIFRNRNGELLISGIAPMSGPVGSRVGIVGGGFSLTPAENIVRFGTTQAVVAAATKSYLMVQVPAGVPSGSVSISVEVSGTTAAAPGLFLVIPLPPTITSLSPAAGGVGTTLTIAGTNFDPTPANNIVWFGSVRGTVTAATSTSLAITIPSFSSYAPVTVTTGGGTARSRTPFGVSFNGDGGIDQTSFGTNVDLVPPSIVREMAIADLDGDGKPEVITLPGSVLIYRGQSTNLELNESSFSLPVDLKLTNMANLAAADVDGDGRMDLLVSASDQLMIFRNVHTAGALTASSFVGLPALSFPTGKLVVADFDSDGKPEIITVPSAAANFLMMKNLSAPGAILFGRSTSIATMTGTLYGAVASDFDGDGLVDLAVANTYIRMLRNRSNADSISFESPVQLTFSGYSSYLANVDLAAGDFNGDGKNDIAFASSSSSGRGVVLRNTHTSGAFTGGGSFAQDAVLTLESGAKSVRVTDVDGDGKPDAVFSTSGILLFRNTSINSSASLFAPVFRLNVSVSPTNFAMSPSLFQCADLNGDGTPDLVMGVNDGNYVPRLRFYRNQQGAFLLTGIAPAAGPAGSTILIQGKGFDTTTIANNSVTFGTAAATVSAATRTTLSVTVPVMAVGPVTITVTVLGVSATIPFKVVLPPPVVASFSPVQGDTGQVVAITGTNFHPTTTGNIVRFGPARAWVTEASATSLTVTVPRGAQLAPITVTANGLTGASLRNFAPTFSGGNIAFDAGSFDDRLDFTIASQSGMTSISPSNPTVADIDDDGRPDLIVLNENGFGSQRILIYPNKSGPGTVSSTMFGPRVLLSTGYDPKYLVIADLDGDGRQDIVITTALNTNSIQVFKNNTAPGVIVESSFSGPWTYKAGVFGASGLTVGDVDGDGKPDIVSTHQGTIALLKNQFNADSGWTNYSFAPRVEVNTSGSGTIALRDFDGDGKPDIVGHSLGGQNVATMRNVSIAGVIDAASFAAPVNMNVPYSPKGLVVADLNNDGKQDVAIGNYGGNNVAIMENTTTNPGTITFGTPVLLTGAANNTTGLAVGDIDGNGKPDLLATFLNSQIWSLFRNVHASGSIAAGSFEAKADFTAPSAFWPTINDLDGDAKPEVMMVRNNPWYVQIFRNVAGELRIVRILPFSAQVGSSITIVGGGFSTTAASNLVTFGAAGAVVDSATTTRLYVKVPNGPTPGPVLVSVEVGGKRITSAFTVLHPAPVISTIAPLSDTLGAAVTIDGSNFSSTPTENLVLLGGVRAPVATATSVRLTVPVPPGLGYLPLSVQTGRTTVTSSAVVTAKFSGDAFLDQSSFAPKVDLLSGSNPQGLFSGDFDRDGKPDFVTTNYFSSSVSVRRNSSKPGVVGVSSFAPKSDFSVGSYPAAGTIADLDGDGRVDMIVANANSASVSLLKNVSAGPGSANFAVKVDLVVSGNSNAVAAADLDGDGKPEVVSVNANSRVSIFPNAGLLDTINTSSFSPAVELALPAAGRSVALTDVDGDGKLDILSVNANSTFSVLRNLGAVNGVITTASFAPKVDVSTGNSPVWGIAGDLNKDGTPDVVTANAGDITVSVLLNTSTAGNITFAAKVDSAVGASPTGIALGDVDGNGSVDIIVSNGTASSLTVYRNDGSGALMPRMLYAVGNTPKGILASDVDGDGRPDLVTANYSAGTISVLRNQCGELGIYSVSPSDGPAGTIVTLGGRGFSNVAANNVVAFGGRSAAVDSSTSSTIYTKIPANIPYGVQSVTVTVAGKTGVSPYSFYVMPPPPSILSISAVGGPAGGAVTIAGVNFGAAAEENTVRFAGVRAQVSSASISSLTVNVPAGAWTGPVTVTTGGGTAQSALPFAIRFANGGTFASDKVSPRVDFGTNWSPQGITAADLDGDGKPDLLATNYSSGNVSIYRNIAVEDSLGPASFESKMDLSTGTYPFGVRTFDLDSDGKLDIVISNYLSNSISLIQNTSVPGTLSFLNRIDYATGGNPTQVAIGDLDGDARPEIVAACQASNVVSIFRNATVVPGSPLLVFPKTDVAVGTFPSHVALGDIDGDGKRDIIVTNATTNSVGILRNTSVGGVLSFASMVEAAAGSQPRAVALADLDGNGTLDIVAASGSGSGISFFRNRSNAGTIVLASRQDFAVGSSTYGLTLEDMNGDGKLDLVTGGISGSAVQILQNTTVDTSAIMFGSAVSIAVPTGMYDVVTPDLDADGRPDIVSVNGSFSGVLSVFRNIAGGNATGVDLKANPLPTNITLTQNYPNPFNPATTIQILNPKFQILNLRIYDMLGREVAVLMNEEKPAGIFTINWEAGNLGSGTYFYQLSAGDRMITKKLMLVR